MGTKYIPVDNSNETSGFKELDRAPIGSFTSAWVRTDLGLFRIDLTVISPQSQQPEDYLTLTHGQAEHVLKALQNIVVFFQERLR